ncbi:hypothetical protein JTE90_005172 [Oedothorax gibbosus]|uniref:Reverse transcriptase domain-containing protein n=1 Tax=Oedothorax gibbosus TaxID=931172 RepID=A0AAV6TRQ1_9ARAC|nr:hypothetical protein JTE90_005172 [Oedothorax gibbosus]
MDGNPLISAVGHGVPPNPAGGSGQANTQRSQDSDHLVPAARADLSAICPECGDKFKNNRGLGVHRQRKHKAAFHAEKLGAMTESSRWSTAEEARMAEVEAEIWFEDPGTTRINQIILERLAPYTQRSLESVKGKRRAAAYKALVSLKLAQLQSRRRVAVLTPSPVSAPTPSDMDFDLSFVMGDPISNDPEDRGSPLGEEDSLDETFIYHWAAEYIHSLHDEDRTPSDEYEHLLDAALAYSDLDPEEALKLTEQYILLSVPTKPKPKRGGPKKNKDCKTLSRRKQRREVYKKMQKLYHKNRSDCYNSIFQKTSFSDNLGHEDVFAFWENLLKATVATNHDPADLPSPPMKVDKMIDLLATVSAEEALKSRLPYSSAAGPDDITVKDWNRVKTRSKCKIFTIWARIGRVPAFIMTSRTIFIAKKEEAISPADARPISIASVILRHFHKILAQRLSYLLEKVLDPCQYGFRPKDGIAQAITRLDRALRTSQMELQPITLALIDLKKAFDSIDHMAIRQSLIAIGIQADFVDYIGRLYREAPTKLSFKGYESKSIHPARGVRQGDPLSPLIFLLVFDNILRAIPEVEGTGNGEHRINHLAYADDLVLLAEDKTGLQRIFDAVVPVMRATGLEINIEKSLTLCWLKDGRNKRRVFDNHPLVTVKGRYLRPLEVEDEFVYLGIRFSTNGRFPIRIELQEKL